MQHIGVREFRDRASQFLAGSEPVAIERHGHLIGFFIPVRPEPEVRQRALSRLEAAVQRMVADADLTEDEVAELLEVADEPSEPRR